MGAKDDLARSAAASIRATQKVFQTEWSECQVIDVQTDPHLKTLDLRHNIDVFVQLGVIRRGVSVRIQPTWFRKSVEWHGCPTMTIRCKRETGNRDELSTALKHIADNELIPHYHLHVFMDGYDGPIQTYILVRYKPFMLWVDAHRMEFDMRHTSDRSGKQYFFVIPFCAVPDDIVVRRLWICD